MWDVELDEVHNAVRMTTSLEDGELGLPGNRTFTAVFTVTRTGADCKITCLKCGKTVLMPLEKTLKAVKRVIPEETL